MLFMNTSNNSNTIHDMRLPLLTASLFFINFTTARTVFHTYIHLVFMISHLRISFEWVNSEREVIV